ncbi:hypothetical protein SKAU_G00166850 [Synaphobranchus kaupii]|uniref:Reverse transcriptase domain-containing protein n=1 Tax=Synaphobranchus kaupii TaxID=118154 RepID=A0A9Q1FJL1_SYNKA|nr:hypothetical protein SKAU_G00166850 [Synaphobranchus kaupii]
MLQEANLNTDDGLYIRFRTDGGLFNLRYLLARTKTSEQRIAELLFMDDCAILAHTEEALQHLVDCFSEAATVFGIDPKTWSSGLLIGRNKWRCETQEAALKAEFIRWEAAEAKRRRREEKPPLSPPVKNLFGCPKKFVNILRQFHDGMTARVTIGGQESAPFSVHTGVRQGCVLAPVLFNIFLLCVTKLLHKESEDRRSVAVDFRLDGNLFNIRRFQVTTKLHRERVLELQFADDCALVSHTPQGLQSVLAAAVRERTAGWD